MPSGMFAVAERCARQEWKSVPMSREVCHQFEVLVVGGGPAGLAAAVRAAEAGAKVGIVDDNPKLGGQIWRGADQDAAGTDASLWLERMKARGITVICGAAVFDQPQPGVLLAEDQTAVHVLSYGELILATGARERFLPFPGWTLPNVVGVGGLQAMVKSGLPIRGKRVVIAGTGPLLLTVAAYLRECGAEVPVICEQASRTSLLSVGRSLLRQPGKIRQGFRLSRQLAGVKFFTNVWVASAHGRNALTHVTIRRKGKTESIECDYLACSFHLVPNLELPRLLGCGIRNDRVEVDEIQQTTVPSVYCAGEPTGVGGVELSIVEGEIAGLAAVGRVDEAKRRFRERAKHRAFARALDHAFRLRHELASLPSSETIVCRCEDVRYSRLEAYKSWRSAKLHTRCGMGPCQGRVCSPAVQFLFNWNSEAVRPPIFPVRVESLAASSSGSQSDYAEVLGGSK
jgi:NADPH-dependent 2,4-dienoyl-CoA reductase/sulfur reductase-like enzyme